jgi:hypothetical protein
LRDVSPGLHAGVLGIVQSEVEFEASSTGVVDQNVEPAVLVQNGAHHVLPVRFLADVQVVDPGCATDRRQLLSRGSSSMSVLMTVAPAAANAWAQANPDTAG